ncbi:MAG: hypothetical protein ACC656_13960, partial [Candidatus Heimdallarchaeota archaeon]
MYRPSYKPTNNQSIFTFLLIGLLVIVTLNFGLTISVSDTVSTQKDISNVEMDKIANLDFSSQPEISKELQSRIDATMSGFNTGFRENPNLDSEVSYLLSSSQMDIRFSQSEVQFRIPNYDPSIETKEIVPADGRIDFDISENRIIEDIGPEQIGYTVATLEFVGSNQVQP